MLRLGSSVESGSFLSSEQRKAPVSLRHSSIDED